jgi:hypothetical protein
MNRQGRHRLFSTVVPKQQPAQNALGSIEPLSLPFSFRELEGKQNNDPSTPRPPVYARIERSRAGKGTQSSR